MNRRIVLRNAMMLTTSAAALFATRAFAQVAQKPAPLSPPAEVMVGVLAGGSISDAGIFIAQDKGFFEEEGIVVKYFEYRGTPDIFPSLATSQIQISGASLSPALFSAVDRNIRLKVVADKGQVADGFGWTALCIRSDLAGSVREYKDLKGLKIAIPAKGAATAAHLGKALELGGLGPDDVTLVELGLSETITGLTNKAIDAAMLLEPFVTFATSRGLAVRWKGVDEILPYKGQNGVIVYSEKFANEQPEVAKRWMVAYLRGIRAYNDAMTRNIDRDGIVAILMKNTAVKTAALYAKMAPTGFDPNGRVEIPSIDAAQDWYIKLRLMTKKGDLGKLIDYSYADYALSRIGKR